MNLSKPITLLISLVFTSIGFCAEATTIRVALLDSFYNELPLVPQIAEYENAYYQGVEVAAYQAQQYGYDVTYKSFVYNANPLAVLQELPQVVAWQPDLIIGPSSSDQCLLLGKNLPDTMVLSSYASDVNLKKLPKHFYSTFLPDDKIMDLLSQFILNRFPHKDIYIIEQIECKQCTNAGELLTSSIHRQSPDKTVTQAKIVINAPKDLEAKTLLNQHEDDVIVIFNATYYEYINIIDHLSSAYPEKQMVFISDQDSWSDEVDGKQHPLDLKYQSFRIGPILFDTQSPEFTAFKAGYNTLFNADPKNSISFMTYYSVLSAIEALHQYPSNPALTMREAIKQSYITALNAEPGWFRQHVFGIYQLTSQGEVLVKRLNQNGMFPNSKQKK